MAPTKSKPRFQVQQGFRVDFTPIAVAKSTQKVKRRWPKWFRVDFTPVAVAKSTRNLSFIWVGAIRKQ